MARIVTNTATGPMEVKIGTESKWICMCGLTSNPPFCNGAHKQCAGESEGKLYKYKNGERIEVKE